jgi:hypothetical protein
MDTDEIQHGLDEYTPFKEHEGESDLPNLA